MSITSHPTSCSVPTTIRWNIGPETRLSRPTTMRRDLPRPPPPRAPIDQAPNAAAYRATTSGVSASPTRPRMPETLTINPLVPRPPEAAPPAPPSAMPSPSSRKPKATTAQADEVTRRACRAAPRRHNFRLPPPSDFSLRAASRFPVRLKMAALAGAAVLVTLAVLLAPTYSRVRAALARAQGERLVAIARSVAEQLPDDLSAALNGGSGTKITVSPAAREA